MFSDLFYIFVCISYNRFFLLVFFLQDFLLVDEKGHLF